MSPPNTETAELTQRASTMRTDEETKYERDYVPPSFTIKELREAVPAHCFERDTLRSFGYAARDLAVVSALAFAATYIDSHLPPALRFVAWPVYWFWAGAFATGLWVIAHECGHQSFSPSKTINNTVGLLLHSAMLVPYHSWRITHGKHHKHTGHMTKDQVFVPHTRSARGLPPKSKDPETSHHSSMFEDAPLYQLIMLTAQQLVGWPLYLLFNFSGQDYGRWTSHFHPSSPIFESKHYYEVIISDIGIAVALSCLGYFTHVYGFLALVKYYLVPYLIVNHWLVAITYLQHTDPKLPHYREGAWSFVRGAAATVDRHLGILDPITHRICSTHVAHHCFSQMPHYHAEEATQHIKKVMGPYYIFDNTPFFSALWRSYKECIFVEDQGEVVFYKS